MIRYFNFQEQLLVIFVLAAVQIYPHFFVLPPGWPLLVDVVSVFSIVHLVGGYLFFFFKNLRRLPSLAASWAGARESRRTLAILREFCVWGAVVFLGLRFSRWTLGWEAGWRLHGVEHYDNYVDVALMLLLFSWMLSMRRIVRGLGRLDLTSGRRLIFSYVVLVVGGSLMLVLPVSVNEGQVLRLIDAVFITVSAISVTGLSTVPIADVLSMTGQSIVLILIQIGGLGIIVITAGLAAATWRRMSLNQSMQGKELYDIPDFGNMGQFLSKVTILTFSLELLGATLLFFSLPPDLENRFFHALFHSISAFCNAGFSTLPANLQDSPFSGLGIGIICLLIVLGGLGFPLLFELLSFFRPGSKKSRRISANSSLTLAVTIVLLVLGAASIFLMQSFTKTIDAPLGQRFWQSLFYSVSSRTAGFNMVPVVELGSTSVLMIMLLMVVGGGPMSTAGGVKTTTLGVVMATAWATMTGRQGAQFAGRTIPDITIHRAVTGFSLYFVVASFACVFLILLEGLDPWAIIFEVLSALSTVGLSLGITGELSGWGKFILVVLMLVGRIGLVTFVYAGLGRLQTQRFRYPKDSFFVG